MSFIGGADQVNKKVIIKIIANAILVPLISVFLLNKINLFSYLTFIPEDKRFDVGLICYMAIFETLFEGIVYWISQQSVTVECVFYRNKNEKDIQNTPTAVCKESTGGVAYVQCGIKLIGNVKRLQSCQLIMNMPTWINVQIGQADTIASYNNNDVTWNISELISTRGTRDQIAEYDSKISFIRNQSDNSLKISVKPILKGKYPWQTIGFKFVTNSVIIMNRE